MKYHASSLQKSNGEGDTESSASCFPCFINGIPPFLSVAHYLIQLSKSD